ncbi:hypothetical protein CLV28_0503 [Sediminihabitans luteus]|uniref:Uncharacterized protein n=1 Tax=Sediminihabitans luteus TaxID=1138585 RepID=A0A2M9CZG8_9CELL|nr:hypothetical protein [Sediminihabitans luteus]PJJ77287.1 hypothetical protein CLV28_0503 [Sediminihabitans luteus]GII98737.1 hypothetical protein Slu03_11150 [Sediminihabitans luteus]
MANYTVLVLLLAPLWCASVVPAIVLAVLLERSCGAAPATGATPAETALAAARQSRRHAGLTAALAAVAAFVVAPPVALVVLVAVRSSWVAGAVLVGLVPAAASATFLGVHALGERRRPRERGVVRTASLTPPSAADVAPRGLRVWLTVALGITTVAVALPGAVLLGLTEGTAEVVATAGGFGGLLVVAVGTALGAHLVLGVVATRTATPGVDAGWDADLRRLAAHRVLRGAALLVVLVGAGSLLTTAVAGVPLAAAPGVLLLLVGVGVALVPGPVPRDPAPAARATGGDPAVAGAAAATRSTDA